MYFIPRCPVAVGVSSKLLLRIASEARRIAAIPATPRQSSIVDTGPVITAASATRATVHSPASVPTSHLRPLPNPPPRRSSRASGRRQQPPPPSPLHCFIVSGPPMDATTNNAAMLCIQNMMVLCRQLGLPVSYKVHEWWKGQTINNDDGDDDTSGSIAEGSVAAVAAVAPSSRRFSVIVHVHGDHAFRKYLQNFSSSDMLLYRGLLLQVETTLDLSRILSARVQQAFLPKFDNEVQDAAVADQVVGAAVHGRPTVITIKHSGSLVTLSYDGGWAAKNSVSNDFTAGGAVLLRAHYDRRHPYDPAAASAALDRVFKIMAARRLCLGFEMVQQDTSYIHTSSGKVTGSHGHHGQLPAAEYLVTTAAHTFDPVTGAPTFLDWLPFLELCMELGLPTNDTWVVGGGHLAGAARQALDALALRGGPTGHALRTLDELVSEGGGCMRLPGTYPHDEWQGNRLEGFVVEAGQELGPEEIRRLQSILGALEVGRLPLATVPEHLHRPYLHELRSALVATSGGDTAPTPTVSGGGSEAVRWRLQAAAAALMPHTALSYTSPGADVQQTIRELLTSQLPKDLEYGKAYIELPEGRGRMYSRSAMDNLDSKGLQELLEAELTAASAGGADMSRARALREVMAAAAAVAASASATDSLPDMLLVRAMRALAGHPEASVALRYKKKMILWKFPDDDSSATAAANGSSSGDDGVVGYSLMTFVIRNGLPALCQGSATYAAYVDNLVRRSWALPKPLVTQVQHFACCWAAWVAARGGAAGVDESRYLDVAEPFAQEFLRRRGAMALNGRSETAFQGVLICVDTSEAFTQSLRRTVAPSLDINAAKLGNTGFSKGMVSGGVMLWLQPGSELPKRLREFLSSGAAPYTWVVAASAPRSIGSDNAPEAKRQKGLAQAKINAVTAVLGADGAASRVRYITQPAPEDDVDGTASARLAAEVASWLGSGTPVPPADPAVAAYFVTIPGAGKSALTKGMTLPAARDGQQQEKLTVKVLNSDILRKTAKSFNPGRYWLEVASAADSCQGGGHVVVSVADKNLVPSPPGNIARALEPLKGTGVATLAIVPVVAGPSTLSAPAAAHADMYGSLPELPFPLELVALCILRTLKRRNHEGGLDGEKEPATATVVAMFAGFYRHKALPDLLAALRMQFTRVVELPIMRGDGGGSVPVEVLRHVAAGVRDVSERLKPQLPEAWEAQTRKLLLRSDVVEALEALQFPIEEVRRRLEEELASSLEEVKAVAAVAAAAASDDATAAVVETMSASPTGKLMDIDGGSAAEAAAETEAEERVSYFSIEGLDDEVLRAAAREMLPSELHAKLRRGSLHVTLWHRADPELGPRTEIRNALMGLVGTPVEMEVTDIDISPEVIAAHVRLLCADEAIPARPYHHITLAVETGHSAVESNQLPARLAAGEAGVERRPLPQGPLLLRGVVTAVEAAKQPLTPPGRG